MFPVSLTLGTFHVPLRSENWYKTGTEIFSHPFGSEPKAAWKFLSIGPRSERDSWFHYSPLQQPQGAVERIKANFRHSFGTVLLREPTRKAVAKTNPTQNEH
jgi:hypothetical protein